MLCPSTIADFMSAASCSIDAHESLRSAQLLMAEHHLRALPVREHGLLCGVTTERDLELVGLFTMSHALRVLSELIDQGAHTCEGMAT